MKKTPLKLSKLVIQSFVTAVLDSEKLKGGTVCPNPDISRAGPAYCVTGSECDTQAVETCHSTGNTDDPTGFFTQVQMGCLSGD